MRLIAMLGETNSMTASGSAAIFIFWTRQFAAARFQQCLFTCLVADRFPVVTHLTANANIIVMVTQGRAV
jgi:hypothetical protein